MGTAPGQTLFIVIVIYKNKSTRHSYEFVSLLIHLIEQCSGADAGRVGISHLRKRKLTEVKEEEEPNQPARENPSYLWIVCQGSVYWLTDL